MATGSCALIASFIDRINFTLYAYPHVIVPMATWEVWVKSVAVFLLIVAAVVGNVLIIIIVCSSKTMRTTTNIYIANLAGADLIIACLPTWIYLLKDVKKFWAVGWFFCKFNAFIQIQAMCALSLIMIVIAGDRFFAVVYPLKARVTHNRVKYVLVIVWTTAIAVAVPQLVFYQYLERQWGNYLEKVCETVWPKLDMPNGECDMGRTSQTLYYIVVLATLHWIPMVAMSISYTIIIYRLRWGQDCSCGSENVPIVQKRSTRKVIKLLFVLLIAFIVCAVPFQVTTLYSMTKDPVKKLPGWFQPLYYTAQSLMFAHSFINPLVYGAMSHSFRSGFRSLFTSFRNNRMWSSRKTEMKTNCTTRKAVSILSKDGPGFSQATFGTDLARSCSQINLHVIEHLKHKQSRH
ncbi:hypothetical protein BsWGS_21043 [Bradybaena similaris]